MRTRCNGPRAIKPAAASSQCITHAPVATARAQAHSARLGNMHPTHSSGALPASSTAPQHQEPSSPGARRLLFAGPSRIPSLSHAISPRSLANGLTCPEGDTAGTSEGAVVSGYGSSPSCQSPAQTHGHTASPTAAHASRITRSFDIPHQAHHITDGPLLQHAGSQAPLPHPISSPFMQQQQSSAAAHRLKRVFPGAPHLSLPAASLAHAATGALLLASLTDLTLSTAASVGAAPGSSPAAAAAAASSPSAAAAAGTPTASRNGVARGSPKAAEGGSRAHWAGPMGSGPLPSEGALGSQVPSGAWPHQPALVVFSGGTAFNSVAGQLRRLTTRVTYVLPISDDGGSTAEVVRVLGGPAVGDIRSRCLRLADSSDSEARAVKALLAHRLPAGDPAAAKAEWYQVVEGEHALWEGVSEPYKHVIRAYLVHFHHQILAHASERFNFSNGSIGNFFFAGARTFFRSLEAAVFLFSRVARIPEGCTVLPAICTEERIALGAELEDGTLIYGQNNISHPPTSGDVSQVHKSSQDALPSPIRRIFYLSATTHNTQPPTSTSTDRLPTAASLPPSEQLLLAPTVPTAVGAPLAVVGGGGCVGAEVLPSAHPTALAHIAKADAVIFGCGSLYTSICPTICLEGMGEAIAARNCHKILVLNGGHDRETSTCGAHEGPMTAADIVHAVTDTLNRRRTRQGAHLRHPPCAYITGVLVPEGGQVEVDRQALGLLGIQHVLEVRSLRDPAGHVVYHPNHLVDQIAALVAQPLPVPVAPAREPSPASA